MNKREKKLLILTLGIVTVGGVTWFAGRSKPDAETPTAEAAQSEPEGLPPVLPNATARIAPATYIVSARDLERLTRWKQDLADLPADIGDPFRVPEEATTKPNVVAPPNSTGAVELPRVTALYYDSTEGQGAILDNRVLFRGENHRGFEILEVTPEGVHLLRGGERYFAPYAPGPFRPVTEKDE